MKESLSNKDTAFKTHTGGKKKYVYLALAGAACIIGMACYGFTYDGTDFDHEADQNIVNTAIVKTATDDPQNQYYAMKTVTTTITPSQLHLFGSKQSSTYNSNFVASKALNAAGFAHTKIGVGQWWQAKIQGGDAYVVKVQIQNRPDCCGERLAGSKVYIGSQLCGSVQMGTKDGLWYTVQCKQPLQGGTVKVETIKNTYLQIAGIKIWGQSKVGSTSSVSTTTTTISASNLDLIGPKQSSTYSKDFVASKALNAGFAHTLIGVGQWWQANFKGGDAYVVSVQIQNRPDCCGERLAGSKVYIGSQLCGSVQMGTKDGLWYTVQCKQPLLGSTVKVETVTNTYLQIAGIKVMGAKSWVRTPPV